MTRRGDKHASNILYSVSAAELKAEEMIKMPIRLTTDRDWRKTIGAACDCRRDARRGGEGRGEGDRRIHPAASSCSRRRARSPTDPDRLTWEVIEKHLIEDRGSPRIRSPCIPGPRKDLDAPDRHPDPDCPVRYIITVQKLKEGWDCPFAYVLCSVAEQVSPTAIEQILGRVLRMPKARRKRRDALNQAYAYVASRSFDETAQQLKTGLVEGAGFNRLEAEQIVTPQRDMGFDADAEQRRSIDSEPCRRRHAPSEEMLAAIESSRASVRARVAFDPDTRSMTYKGPMTRESRNLLHLALAKSPRKPSAPSTGSTPRSNSFQVSASEDEDKPPFIVPMLGIPKAGRTATILARAFPRPALAARRMRPIRHHRSRFKHRRSRASQGRSTSATRARSRSIREAGAGCSLPPSFRSQHGTLARARQLDRHRHRPSRHHQAERHRLHHAGHRGPDRRPATRSMCWPEKAMTCAGALTQFIRRSARRARDRQYARPVRRECRGFRRDADLSMIFDEAILCVQPALCRGDEVQQALHVT